MGMGMGIGGGASRSRNVSGVRADGGVYKENDRSASGTYTSANTANTVGAAMAMGGMGGTISTSTGTGGGALSAPVRQSLAGGPLRAPSGGRASNVWR